MALLRSRLKGGTGQFTARLFDNTDALVKEQAFNGTTTLSHLKAGTYSLRVEDSNGCVAKDAAGREIVHRITLTEPAESVAVELVSLISPLAYNSSDGSIEVKVSGGTPLASGYNVRFVRSEDGQSLRPTNVRPERGYYVYTLGGIPSGEYTVIVEDARYTLLGEEDKNAPCGCKAELAMTITAPPPLEVQIEETHFVSCHGDSNGELTAHAVGGKPITSAQLPYVYAWYRIVNGAKEELPLQRSDVAKGLKAGRYLVKITDANGIFIESSVFDLVQPEPLALTFGTRSPSCSGGVGEVEARVTGGTAPYSYEWNKEGETEASIRTNEAGTYFVRITDSRGCTLSGTTELTAPDAVKVSPTISHPTCHGASNGSIALELSGGTAPYIVSWEDTSERSIARSGLKAGEYVAIVSDVSGCSLRYRLALTEPEALSVSLSEGFTLCHDQTRTLTATSYEEGLTYQWRRDGRTLSETSNTLSVSEGGLYEVTVSNAIGCRASAKVNIGVSSTELPLDIAMPSLVVAGAPIHAVNISQVRADRLEWRLPEGAVVQSKTDERLVFSMPTPGRYTLVVVGYLGECSTLISQNIDVTPAGGVVLPDGKEEALIKQFLVSPNPTSGEFKIYVELRQPMDFALRLLSPTGVEMDSKVISNVQKQTFEYELRGDVEGTFFVEFVVGGQKSTLRIRKERG